jgi:ABC-type Zn uptake system ZnuABC Zn-binding protein ZnuA
MTMRYLLLSVLAAAMAVMLCGCQESSSSGSSADIQRARLVGNENIQLKSS